MKNRNSVVTDIVTKEDLVEAFGKVGIGKGRIVEVHCSLSSMGYVIGGAQTVVDALMEAVTDTGTILMPMHTGDNTDPGSWRNPPAAPYLWSTIRETMPASDPRISDLRGMGRVAENFRHRPDVEFSSHPCEAYAAWGRYARLLCNRQSLHFPLSEESPAARLYELRGDVLLIGTGIETCTCMHLAEYRSDCRPIRIMGSSVGTEEGTGWKKYLDLEVNSEDFKQVEPILLKKGLIRQVMLNSCRIMSFSAVDAIDEAMNYFDYTSVFDLYR